jgi:hypothetical protein
MFLELGNFMSECESVLSRSAYLPMREGDSHHVQENVVYRCK